MKPVKALSRGKLSRLAGGGFMLCLTLIVAASSIRSARASAPHREPETELLEAEKAFVVAARLINDQSLELRYAIADGYYMYRDRFRFTVNGQPVSMSRQSWPAGKWKQDANFGKVITYRKSVRLLLPIPTTASAGSRSSDKALTLSASSQGCADAGVCYPPLRQTLTLIPGSSAWVEPQEGISSGFSHGGTSNGALTVPRAR
jgi:thiol:disulfide interchange protein DsbD